MTGQDFNIYSAGSVLVIGPMIVFFNYKRSCITCAGMTSEANKQTEGLSASLPTQKIPSLPASLFRDLLPVGFVK